MTQHPLNVYLSSFSIFMIVDYATTRYQQFKVPDVFQNSKEVCFLVFQNPSQNIDHQSNCVGVKDLSFVLGALYSRLPTQTLVFTEEVDNMRRRL